MPELVGKYLIRYENGVALEDNSSTQRLIHSRPANINRVGNGGVMGNAPRSVCACIPTSPSLIVICHTEGGALATIFFCLAASVGWSTVLRASRQPALGMCAELRDLLSRPTLHAYRSLKIAPGRPDESQAARPHVLGAAQQSNGGPVSWSARISTSKSQVCETSRPCH